MYVVGYIRGVSNVTFSCNNGKIVKTFFSAQLCHVALLARAARGSFIDLRIQQFLGGQCKYFVSSSSNGEEQIVCTVPSQLSN